MKLKAVLLATVLSGVVASASAINLVPNKATMYGRLILSVDSIYSGDIAFGEAAGLAGSFAPGEDGQSLPTAPGATEGFVSLTSFDGRWAQVDMVGDARRHPMVITVVPEPEIYVLMLAGLGAFGFLTRRRRAQG